MEPFSTIAHGIQTVILWVARDFEEGLRIGNTAIDLDANSYLGYKMTALVNISPGRYQEGIEMIRHSLDVSSRFQWSVFDHIWAYSLTGNREGAQELTNELDERSAKEYVSPFNKALVYAWSGDLDKSFAYIETAISDRDPMLLTIKSWHNVPDNPKNDYRHPKIIERIGFPETSHQT